MRPIRTMRFIAAITVLFGLAWLPGLGHARQADVTDAQPAKADAGRRLRAVTSGEVKLGSAADDASPGTTSGDSASGMPPPPDLGLADAKTIESYREGYRALIAYRNHGLEHRLRVYKWQLGCSTVIFIVVLLLVASGIYFAAVQFFHGLRASGSASDPQSVTVFSASEAGVKISSPVLGVIILVISLAFFYLYLVYVYNITESF